MIKNLPANAGDVGLTPGLGRSPEGNDSPSRIPAWRILWTEKPGAHEESDMTEGLSSANKLYIMR